MSKISRIKYLKLHIKSLEAIIEQFKREIDILEENEILNSKKEN